MTNEEAREILKRVEIAKPIKFEDYADMREALDMAIKALEQQQNIHDTCKNCVEFSEFIQTGWIPVSERVPEVGQHVLVTSHGRIHLCLADSYGTVTVIMPIISKDATEIVFHPQPDWGDGYAAWMPLPEPYKAESEGAE